MTLTRCLMVAGLATMPAVAPAFAQPAETPGPPCAERSHVAEQLRAVFGERMIGGGLAASGVLFELYVAPTGTWTLLATAPDGSSCLLGTGEAWEPRPEPDAYAAR